MGTGGFNAFSLVRHLFSAVVGTVVPAYSRWLPTRIVSRWRTAVNVILSAWGTYRGESAGSVRKLTAHRQAKVRLQTRLRSRER